MRSGRSRRDLLLAARGEARGEIVDDAVEGLVGDGLALVAAPGEDERALLTGLVGEAAEQGALAHSRRARDVDHHRRRACARGTRARHALPLRLAADEAGAHELGHHAGAAGGVHQQELQESGAAGSIRRVGAQEGERQGAQVDRHVGEEQVRGRGRVVQARVPDGHGLRGDERRDAGERLVEHEADRVPVRGLRHVLVDELLGRHPRRRAEEPARAAGHRGERIGRPWLDGLHEAAVEDDDPPPGLEEHVGGLEVEVDEAGLVERVDAAHELGEGVAHPRDRGRQRGRALLGASACARARPLHGGVDGRRPRGRGRAGRGRRRGRRRAPGAADPGEEVRAVDALHGEEPQVVLAAQLVERHQVGVGDARDRAKLGLEAEQALRGHAAERLEGDPDAVLPLDRVVDLAHPALAEEAGHVVRAEPDGVVRGRGGQLDSMRRCRAAGCAHDG